MPSPIKPRGMGYLKQGSPYMWIEEHARHESKIY